VCDHAQGCDTAACIWDMGDCGNVLSAVLGLDADVATASSAAQIAEVVAVQSGFVKQSLYIGILIGLCVAVSVGAILCHVRRKHRRMQLTNQTYTPYGQAGGDDLLGAGAIAPKLASAADDDDDDDGPDGR